MDSVELGPSPEQLWRAARRLRVDAWTVRIVKALRHASVEPILLKGPAVAQWLYHGELLARSYQDIDLLVSPDDQATVERVLTKMGYSERALTMPTERRHACDWVHSDGGVAVDLHRVLHGLERVAPIDVWRVVNDTASTIQLRDITIRVPGAPVRTLHLAMHLSHRDGPGWQAWHDLERGIQRIAPGEWGEAASLARRLDADGEMGAKLRRLDRGADLADQLGLHAAASELYTARLAAVTGRTVPTTHALAQFRARAGAIEKARYVLQKLIPPPSVLRARLPIANRGLPGLAAAYTWRAIGGLARLPRAISDLRRLRPR